VFESVHASCREDRGTVLMNYLRVGWQVGHRLGDHIAHPDVFEAMRISKQVGFETHKFTGLVRFCLVGGTFYCDFEPDNDILPFLAPHFADRLRDQNWILHDVGRDVAAIFDKACETWTILPLSARVSAGAEEDPFIALWLTYHKTISIKERENPKLQRQFMPRRYWKHLSEMKDKIRPG
jgi:probable DNA metabolism protein